ncbi:hypothetical protein quinque_014189 [Culex quinquefasciatus]
MTLEYNSDCNLNEGDTLCIEDSDEDQESKTGEDAKSWHHNFKKLSRIIDSDSDEADRTVTTRRNLIKSLVDSDSSSGRDQESVGEKKRKKKLNTKERSQALEKKNDPKDLLASMFAKAAEQMKLIQSESQRIAREASVSVPYHKPKRCTLEEFLNRRTVQNPLEFPVDGRCHSDASGTVGSVRQVSGGAREGNDRVLQERKRPNGACRGNDKKCQSRNLKRRQPSPP